jgi:hypothetical protein
MARQFLLGFVLCAAQLSAAQSALQSASSTAPTPAPVKSTFRVLYISGSDVYIDGGRAAGLAENMPLILKQDPSKAAGDASNKALEPGIVARLKVISVASTSAVCEVEAMARPITTQDVISLTDSDRETIVDKQTLGNTRAYPLVVSFSTGDPLDEEVREAQPRPPLPEVNQIRGRIGFDVSTIRQLGQATSVSNAYGMVFRADFTRMFGTHWNLNGYWRGQLRTNSSASQATLQDLMNRTYLMSLTYVNPDSNWTAGVGRLYIPWASSLETIDGAYLGRDILRRALAGVFAGSTPDPTAWDYNPQRRIGGFFLNVHGGSFDAFHYSTTAGAGVDMLKWVVNRPFVFTENNFSYGRYFSVYHSMQIDRPTPNPSTPAVGTGLGQSLLSLRIQVHPRVVLDLTDTYFRDVPTYEPALVGTGLLDKYLYQGINGGARIQFPRHVTGYFSLGNSSNSTDGKDSGNELFGATVSDIWKTGLQTDVRYSRFNSSFATGTYTTITITRDLLDKLRLNVQGGRYAYASTAAANGASQFVNLFFDTNLGSRLFLESMFTAQRGGSLDYNQWTTTLGYRFDNRARYIRRAHAGQP